MAILLPSLLLGKEDCSVLDYCNVKNYIVNYGIFRCEGFSGDNVKALSAYHSGIGLLLVDTIRPC